MKELTEMSVDELMQRQQELAEEIPEETRGQMTTESDDHGGDRTAGQRSRSREE